jgi:hypothetical protein
MSATETSLKSRVSTPAHVERERSWDLPVISTRPTGESLRKRKPPFEPTQVVSCVCSEYPKSSILSATERENMSPSAGANVENTSGPVGMCSADQLPMATFVASGE